MKNRLLINGRLVEGALTLDVINPATGKVFATCARADAQQLEQAVAAARHASKAWAALTYAERGQYLARLATALNNRKDELAELITREQGKPLADALMEPLGSAWRLNHYSQKELQDKILRQTDHSKVLEIAVPLGVVAVIVPWNFPLIGMVTKIAPALLTGNTVVAKPAPTTPLSALLLGEIAADIFPPGVLNIIVDANDLGDRLTAHPGIDKVSLTGSVTTGRRVMTSVGATLKRLTLELGGNDVAIILDDANLDDVAPKIFNLAMYNAGQVCLAAKRVYAPRGMYDALCEKFVAYCSDILVDDGLKPGTQMGPVQNKKQYERVLELIHDSRQHGKIIAGGHALERDGYFIAPTVIRDLPHGSRLVREEQFGPVIPVLTYDSTDEVIALANDTEFGLGGTIWTSNFARGLEIARQINSGTIWINQGPDGDLDIPFGGAKQSGFGREGGIDGLAAFTQPRIIVAPV